LSPPQKKKKQNTVEQTVQRLATKWYMVYSTVQYL